MRHWALELSLLTMCSSGDPVKLLKLQGTEVRGGVGRDAWCPKAKTRVYRARLGSADVQRVSYYWKGRFIIQTLASPGPRI